MESEDAQDGAHAETEHESMLQHGAHQSSVADMGTRPALV